MTAAAAHAFDEIATILDDAMRKRAPVARIVDRHPDLTHADAYAIQEKVVARRLGRGGRMVGIKMGLTSRAKMQQVGVNEAIWGRLTSDMSVEEGGAVESDRFIHPRTEPEIAYLLGRDLAGDETPAAIAAAVEAAMPALEIIDSRYRGFKFGPADVIADNTSAAGFVVGGELRVVAGDLKGDSLGSWVKTLLADAFFWTDNDLVVQTRSMYGGTPRAAGNPPEICLKVPERRGGRGSRNRGDVK